MEWLEGLLRDPFCVEQIRAALHEAIHEQRGPLLSLLHDVQAVASPDTSTPAWRWADEQARAMYERGLQTWQSGEKANAQDMTNVQIKAIPSSSN